MAHMPENDLRVVIFEEDGLHVAQCLEYDIASHGDTPEQAIAAFGHAYIRHILTSLHLGVEPFADLEPAPPQFKAMWERSCEAGHERRAFRIPDFQVRRRNAIAPQTSRYARAAEAVCA